MPSIPPEIAVYPVQHLPIIKAYADQLGLVSLINHYVPTEMDVDAGTIVLGLVLDTLSGRSPGAVYVSREGYFSPSVVANNSLTILPDSRCGR